MKNKSLSYWKNREIGKSPEANHNLYDSQNVGLLELQSIETCGQNLTVYLQ
jgi:hypothetical protein